VAPTQSGSSPAPAAAQAEVFSAPRQDKPWGHELIFAAVDGLYAGKIIQVRAGHALSLQYHRDKDETISVLAGEALFEYGPDVDELTERGPVRFWVDAPGAATGWYRSIPAVTLVEQDGSRWLLELDDAAGEQAVLRAALAVGSVHEFRRDRPTLTQLFRNVMTGTAVHE